ncbi:MAG: GAF domain-containing protein, partial [Anaerolineales bacterium]
MGTPKKPQQDPKNDAIWASALRAAAGVTRKAASSESDVLRAVTEELKHLKLRSTVALLTPDGQLEVQTRPVSQSIENTLRRLTGLQIAGYRFDPQQVDIYREALSSGEAVYTTKQAHSVRQIMPKKLQPLLSRVMHLLGREQPAVVAPLILGDRSLGTLSVAANWLTADDNPMVAALADHISIALGHVRTRKKMEASLERERLRNQVAETLSSALEPSVVFERVIHLAAEMTNAEAGVITLIEPDGETITYPYLFGLPDSLRSQPTPRGQGLAWLLIESRTPIILPDYKKHPNALPPWVDAGVRSFLGVPLITGDEIIGGLGLFSLTKDRPFGDEQLEIAQAIASMAAITIKNARSYAEATKRAEESQALIRTASSIGSSLDQEIVLQSIAEQAKVLLQADGSRIHLVDPEKGILRCLIALDPEAEAIRAIELEIGQGITGYVAEQGVPVLVNDPSL